MLKHIQKMFRRTPILITLSVALVTACVVSYFATTTHKHSVHKVQREWKPLLDFNREYLQGYTPDPQGTRDFLSSLQNPQLSDKNDKFRNFTSDKPVLLYRYLYDAYFQYSGGEKWVVGEQGIGDCVSWGFAHACDINSAVQYRLGETSRWQPIATEPIYGGSRVEARNVRRGGYSDGSYGGAAAKWLKNWGVLHRKNYPELGFDLSVYSAQRAKSWGNYGNGGKNDNGKADEKAKEFPVKDVALVTTFDEAAAAITSGYPVAVCSMQGFSSTRDKDGFAAQTKRWAHCMVFIGVRYDRKGLLCLNSWGPDWIRGPKWPDDMPEGSFWVEERTVNKMLSQKDSFAVSGVKGFPFRDLRHGEWTGEYNGKEE